MREREEHKRSFFRRLFGPKEEPAADADRATEERRGRSLSEVEEPVGSADSQGDREAEPDREARGPEIPGAEDPAPARVPAEPGQEVGALRRWKRGLTKTREGFVGRVDRVLFGKKVVDSDTLEELEEVLVTADLGVQTSTRLIEGIQEKVKRKELTSPEALRVHLKTAILDIFLADEGHFELGAERPHVLMVVGVNGVGKTTTIGKIAAQFRDRGMKVILAAADTFRAAAIEQLQIWGQRVGAQVVCHQHGADPAAVAFDAVEAAKARGVDLVIVDTAGRLHTKTNLMEELRKVKRVIGKALPGAPHEVLLVLDANNGQNAISQAKTFQEAVGVDAIALAKLDGTAKGGVIVGICDDLKIPVQFVGIGEQVEDLRPFDARAFVEALF